MSNLTRSVLVIISTIVLCCAVSVQTGDNTVLVKFYYAIGGKDYMTSDGHVIDLIHKPGD